MPDSTLPLSPATLALLRARLGEVVGPIELALSLDQVVQDSRDPRWQAPAAHGLWIVGAAINGDAWALDVQAGERLVVLSHELLLSGEIEDPRDAAHPAAASLAEALARPAALPRDHHEAGQRLPEGDDPTFPHPPLDLSGAGSTLPPEGRGPVLTALFGADSGVAWEDLEDALFELGPLERAVLRLRLGLDGDPPLSVTLTAVETGLGAALVRQLEESARRTLRDRLLGEPG